MRNYGVIVWVFLLLMGMASMHSVSGQSINPFDLISEKDSVVVDSISVLEPIVDVVDSSTIVQSSSGQVRNIENDKAPENINPFELIENNHSKVVNVDTSASAIVADVGISEDKPIEEVVVEKTKPKVPNETKNLFVFWISLISGLLLAIAFNSNRNILSEIGKSMQNLNFMKLLQKEESNGWSIAYIILSIIFVLNISIFTRFACIYYEVPLLSYNFINILLLVISFLLIRHLSLYIISYLRKKLAEVINYSFIIITINALLGLILVPINLTIAFGPEVLLGKTIIIGLIVIALSIIIKWFRGFVNSIRIIVGDSFHFLLYLCTCEIVPIMIFVGFMRNLIN